MHESFDCAMRRAEARRLAEAEGLQLVPSYYYQASAEVVAGTECRAKVSAASNLLLWQPRLCLFPPLKILAWKGLMLCGARVTPMKPVALLLDGTSCRPSASASLRASALRIGAAAGATVARSGS